MSTLCRLRHDFGQRLYHSKLFRADFIPSLTFEILWWRQLKIFPSRWMTQLDSLHLFNAPGDCVWKSWGPRSQGRLFLGVCWAITRCIWIVSKRLYLPQSARPTQGRSKWRQSVLNNIVDPTVSPGSSGICWCNLPTSFSRQPIESSEVSSVSDASCVIVCWCCKRRRLSEECLWRVLKVGKGWPL